MSKRQEVREKQRRQQTMNRVLGIGVISLLAIVVVFLMVLPNFDLAAGNIIKPTPMPRPQAKANTMGDPNAPVKIVEYSDFQCPFCKHFFTDTEAKIVDAYVKTGKVYFEYYPVVLISAESSRAAQAALCAGDQNKFWEMHDIIFTNQGAENSGAFSDTRLGKLADAAGLDMGKFNSCFSGGTYKNRVDQGLQAAVTNIHTAVNFQEVVQKQGYTPNGLSTPSFMINNMLVPGAQDFAVYQQIIDAQLAASKK